MGDQEKKIEVKGLFELESCPRKSIVCTAELENINKFHSLSLQFAENKEFVASLHYKKEAFNEVIFINRPSCLNCATFFKKAIYNSALKVQEELHQKSRGLVSRAKYKKQYELTVDIIKDMEKHFTDEGIDKEETKKE